MDWAAIRNEYIASNISQRALAKKYEVPCTTLSKYSVREGWVALRKQRESKQTAKVIEKASEKAANASTMLYDTALEAMALLNDLMRGATDLSDVKTVTGALKDLKVVLDAKSDADIEEQRARIEKLRREAREGEKTPDEVVVRFENVDEEWGR